jgi:hypothetical protein
MGTGISSVRFKVYIPLVKQGINANAKNYLTIQLLQETYTGCPRRNVKNFGRVFLMLKYTDITQNTYIQS